MIISPNVGVSLDTIAQQKLHIKTPAIVLVENRKLTLGDVTAYNNHYTCDAPIMFTNTPTVHALYKRCNSVDRSVPQSQHNARAFSPLCMRHGNKRRNDLRDATL